MIIGDPDASADDAAGTVVMTAPQIGNYGINAEDPESNGPQIAGVVVRELSETYSNWRATGALGSWLAEAQIPIIQDVDTRRLTRHLRSVGVMRGVIGAAVAVIGLMLPGMVVMMTLGVLWDQQRHDANINHFLVGVAASAEPFGVPPLVEPRGVAAAALAPALLRSSPTTKSSPKLCVPAASNFSAAPTIAAIIPFASHEPRPQIKSPSSREPKNGGTVSMCVESVTTGSPQHARILSRSGSAWMRSICPLCRAVRADKCANR